MRTTIHIALLIVTTFLAYSNSLNGEFVFDDFGVVQRISVADYPTLSSAILASVGDRPLLHKTYALDAYLGFPDPRFNMHLTNLIIHALNVLLVYGICLIFVNSGAAFVGALVFAAHPFYADSVAYLTARSSMLAATFLWCALLLGLRAWRSRPAHVGIPWRDYRLWLAIIVFLLGTTVKSDIWVGVGIVAGIALLRYRPRPGRIVAVSSLFVLSVAAVLFFVIGAVEVDSTSRAWVIQSFFQYNRIQTISSDLQIAGLAPVFTVYEYLQTVINNFAFHILPNLVLPIRLTADPPLEYGDPIEFVTSLAIIACLILSMLSMKTAPSVRHGLLFILASPPLARLLVPIEDIGFEYRAYMTGLGVALLAGYAYSRLPTAAHWRKYVVMATLAVVLVLGIGTLRRNAVWQSRLTLWEDAAAKAPKKTRTLLNLSQAYAAAQRPADALRILEYAITLDKYSPALNSNIGAIYTDQQRWELAEYHLMIAARNDNFSEPYTNLGVVKLRTGMPEEALRLFDRAIVLRPSSSAAWWNRGAALTILGKRDEAMKSYNESIRLQSDGT